MALQRAIVPNKQHIPIGVPPTGISVLLALEIHESTVNLVAFSGLNLLNRRRGVHHGTLHFQYLLTIYGFANPK
jgi:hypothetical protein